VDVSAGRHVRLELADRPAELAHHLPGRHVAQGQFVAAGYRLGDPDGHALRVELLAGGERAQRHRDIVARVEAEQGARCRDSFEKVGLRHWVTGVR
jgi:hypothetical protein